jgi:hypothetical protein
MQNSKELIARVSAHVATVQARQGADKAGNGGARQNGSIIQEIIATPFIKQMFRESLNSARASSASELIKNIMWQDMDLFLSLIASSPLIVNSLVNALSEAGRQLDDKFEPKMLKEYLGGVLDEIDTASFSRMLETYGGIVSKLMERDDVRDSVMKSIRETIAASLGRGVNTALKAINKGQDHDPAFIGGTIDSLTAGIDNKEAGRALMGIINPALDRISFTKIIWHFITGRIKYKFQKIKYKISR